MKHTYIIDRALYGDDVTVFENMTKEEIDGFQRSAPEHMTRWTDEQVAKNQDTIDNYREAGILMMVTK